MYGGYKKKWVPKGEGEEAKQEEEAAHEEPTGPSHGKHTMLRFFEHLSVAGITDDFKLGYKTEARNQAAGDEAAAAAAAADPAAQREALRELLKARKKAKREAGDSTAQREAQRQSKNAAADRVAKAAPPVATPSTTPVFPQQHPALQQMWVPPMPYLCPLWGSKATLKLVNLPLAYKQETLAALLVWRFRGALDFLFLPEAAEGSPKDVNNVGHAFVNFRVQKGADDFTRAYNNVFVSTCFPGSQVGDDDTKQNCKVQKFKIHILDKALEDLREKAAAGKSVRLPILVDMFGNARPLPTNDATSAISAAASAGAAAAMSAAAVSGNSMGMALRQQIEYYFSFDNMCRDVYLRSQMDEEGWVPFSLIAGFAKVKQYGVAAQNLAAYLADSDSVEADSENQRLRQKDAKQRVIWELRGALDGSKAPKDNVFSADATPKASEASPKEGKKGDPLDKSFCTSLEEYST